MDYAHRKSLAFVLAKQAEKAMELFRTRHNRADCADVLSESRKVPQSTRCGPEYHACRSLGIAARKHRNLSWGLIPYKMQVQLLVFKKLDSHLYGLADSNSFEFDELTFLWSYHFSKYQHASRKMIRHNVPNLYFLTLT